jgi:hypothetical protein
MEKVVIKTAKFRNTQVNGRAVDYTVVRHKDNDNFIKDTNDECLIRIILTRFALIGWGFVDNLDTELHPALIGAKTLKLAPQRKLTTTRVEVHIFLFYSTNQSVRFYNILIKSAKNHYDFQSDILFQPYLDF